MDINFTIIASFFAGLVALVIYQDRLSKKRIDEFVQNFDGKSQNASGVVMCLLIPSGILNLENDKEIKKALKKIENKIGYPPFRQSVRIEFVEKYGYKKFFQEVHNRKIQLGPESIDSFIEVLKTEKK